MDRALNLYENGFSGNALMRGDGGNDRIQRSDAEWVVSGNGDAVVGWCFGLQNDVAADLMDALVLPALFKVACERFAVKIAWQLHATARTSSRTRRSRMEAGASASK